MNGVHTDIMRATKGVKLRDGSKTKSSFWLNLLWCFRVARLRGPDSADCIQPKTVRPRAHKKSRNRVWNRLCSPQSLIHSHNGDVSDSPNVRMLAYSSLSVTGTGECRDAARAFLHSAARDPSRAHDAVYTRVLGLRCVCVCMRVSYTVHTHTFRVTVHSDLLFSCWVVNFDSWVQS